MSFCDTRQDVVSMAFTGRRSCARLQSSLKSRTYTSHHSPTHTHTHTHTHIHAHTHTHTHTHTTHIRTLENTLSRITHTHTHTHVASTVHTPTVLDRLMTSRSLRYEQVGWLGVGSESHVDRCKSIKSALMQRFVNAKHFDVGGVDQVNACYAGTAALLSAVDWIESPFWDGRWAVVIATDIGKCRVLVIDVFLVALVCFRVLRVYMRGWISLLVCMCVCVCVCVCVRARASCMRRCSGSAPTPSLFLL
jgi:Hydroxymethylglutaryl-coenzyme A synthase N terminal